MASSIAPESDVETPPPPEPKSMRQRFASTFKMQPSHELFTDKRVLAKSLAAVRWAVFVDCCCQTVLQPNFPFMCMTKDYMNEYLKDEYPDVYESGYRETRGYHKDSFPDTGPFDFTASQYFIPMTAGLGSAVASLFFGQLSDKFGRKICLLICMYGGTAGSLLKFFFSHSFWGFCIANFINGLLGASAVVAMVYVSDIFPDDKEKANAEMGTMMGLLLIGGSAGNLIAILMESQGLFFPLLAAAALSFSSALIAQVWMVEADKNLHSHDDLMLKEGEKDGAAKETNEEAKKDDPWHPTKLSYTLMIAICLGSVLDNIGSTGPIFAMAPLMFETYIQTPHLSDSGFKWITTMVMIAIIPGVVMMGPFFKKFGVVGSCIWGNFFTAIQTVGLLFIASEKATSSSLVWFVVVLYVGYPFTVISQLTTGPMLDAIAPESQKGYVQGVNNAVMTFVSAVSPWLLGMVGDATSSKFVIYVCVAFSVLAMFGNAPLSRYPQLQNPVNPNAEVHDDHEEDMVSDEELVKRAEAGQWVPARELDRINEARMASGEQFLRIPYGSYAKEAKHLGKLRKRAGSDFEFFKQEVSQWIEKASDSTFREQMVQQCHTSRPPNEYIDQQKKELGEWFTDYLVDNGWWIENDPTPMKMMIMNSFPQLPHPLTADNAQLYFLRMLKVMNQQIRLSNDEDSTKLMNVLAFKGGGARRNSKAKID